MNISLQSASFESQSVERFLRVSYLFAASALGFIGTAAFGDFVLGFALVIVLLFLRMYVVNRFNLFEHTALYVAYLYLDFSLSAWPVGLVYSRSMTFDYADIFSYTTFTFLIFILVAGYSILSAFFKQGSPLQGRRFYWKDLGIMWLVFAMLFVYLGALLASYISYHLHFDIMGVEKVILPYHLNGVIVYYKRLFVPFASILVLDYSYEKKYRMVFVAIILFFLSWNVLESFVRQSKGQMFHYCLIPIVFWMISRKIISYKYLFTAFLLGALLLFFLPELNRMRHLINSSVSENQDMSLSMNQMTSGLTLPDRLDAAVTRLFRDVDQTSFLTEYMGAIQYAAFRFKEIRAQGGVTHYFTYVVLGAIPGKQSFAAGISLMSEAYLLGGIPLMFITMCAFVYFIALVDNEMFFRLSKFLAGRALLNYLVFILLYSGVWSWVFKGLPAFAWIFVVIFTEVVFRYFGRIEHNMR